MMKDAFKSVMTCAIVGFIGLSLIRKYVPVPAQADMAYLLAYTVSVYQWYHIEILKMRKEIYDRLAPFIRSWLDRSRE